MLGPGVVAPVLADPLSPLTVTKTATPNPVVSGQQLMYTIDVKNTGGAKVTNVVLTDQVNGVGVIQNPPALPQLIITSTQGSCTQGGPNGNVVTCNIGTVNGTASFRVTIRGQVTAGNGTTLNNTASVTGTKSAQNFTTTGSVSVLVSGGTGTPQADLTINKTGPTSVAAGAPLTYTLTVNNIGTANTANVRVVDTLPPGVTLSPTIDPAIATSSLFVCTTGGTPITVTCDGGAVNQGQNATITINAVAPTPAPSPNTITNTAVVDPNNTIAESSDSNNTSAAVYTTVGGPPPAPLLSIFKTDNNPTTYAWSTGAGPDPVNPGQKITYKIQVTNNATGTNSRADDVVVTDGTQGLDAASIVASQVIANGTLGTTGGCVVSAPQVRCSIKSLNSTGTLTITITGTVQQSAGSTIFNTATVTGNIKNTGVTNTASEATTVRPAVDLTITKADSPDPVCARSWPTGNANLPQHLPTAPDGLSPASGTPTALLATPVCLGGLTYDFVVGNSGIAPATNVTVRDPLPAGLIFDSYTTNGGFVCGVDASSVVTCTGGSIPAADTRTITFRLVAPATLGTITNTVTVDPNNAIFEPDETNNTATETTNVATGVDLVTWKSDSNAKDPPGDGAPTLTPGTSTDLGDGYDPIATRGTETYTIYVDNVGTKDTTGIRLRDTLPADTIFLSVVANDPTHPADPTHGFTCSHNGAPTGGVVECVGGHLLGTESEFYNPAGPAPLGPGDDFATIKIRVFARHDVGTMHNEVRVDPLNEIPEFNELNNLATDDTLVTVGNADKGSFQQLTVKKTHVSPAAGTVATNGTLIYDLEVSNLGTDPVSNIIVQDTLPTGTRFISAKDTSTGSAAFFCTHDGSTLGGVITCVGGDLDGSINQIPVGSITRHVQVKVFAPNIPQTSTNTATVDPNNLVPEGNEFDNDTQIDTIVAPCVGQANCTTTNAFYELMIAKSQFSPASTVATNGVITYDLLITNLGSDPASGINVKDTLPAGSRFIDAVDTAPASPDAFSCGAPNATNTLMCSGGTLDGTLDTLGAGVPQARTIRIRIFAPNTPGTYPNQGIVDPANTIPEGNEFNDSSTVNTPVAPCVGLVDCTNSNAFYELTIKKEQNRATIARNGLETYTLTVANLGSDPVSNIVVEDALPVGARLLDAKDTAPPSDPAAFTCGAPDASNVLTCTGGDLSGTVNVLSGVPTSRQIVIRAFMPDTPGTYPNQATVDPSNAIPEGNEFNNTTSVNTIVQNAGPTPWIDLRIDKTQEKVLDQIDVTAGVQVAPGGPTKYVLEISNGGEGDAFNVKVRDVLPASVTFFKAEDEAAGPGNFSCGQVPGQANTVECVGGTIPAGGSRKIDVFVVAPTNLDRIASNQGDIQQTLTNSAFVDPDNAIPEGDESNNVDSVQTVVRSKVNLTVVSKEGPDTAQQNQEADYKITVKNEKVWGDGAIATDAHVVDYLPVGLIPLSVATDVSNMACRTFENPVNLVDCVGDMEPDQTVVITVHVFITAASGAMDNEACIDPDHFIDETNELDNCKTKTTNIGGTTPPPTTAPNLLINKSSSTSVVTPGETFTYTVTVSNVGDATAPNPVTMTDPLPSLANASVTYVSATATNGFICSQASGTVTCTDPGSGLPAGQATVVTIQVTVDADASLPIKNEATVTGGSQTKTASVTTNVGGAAVELVLASVVDSPDPVTAGGVITYTMVVANAGSSAANGLGVTQTFTDTTGLTFLSATGSQGFTCSFSDPVVTCTGNLLAGQSTVLTVKFDTDSSAVGSVSSIIEVDPTNAFTETDEINNIGFETTTVDPAPCQNCIDLVMGPIFVNPDPVANGDQVTWNFDVTNVGDLATSTDSAPNNVVIQINVDGSSNEYTGLSVNIPGFSCTVTSHSGTSSSSPEAVCTKTNMNAGEGALASVTVTANTAADPSVLFFTAAVDPGFLITEFNEANNTGSKTATVDTPPPGP